jgi:photosystem II stability/assembly factor-like uncharacterized protein
VKRITHVFLAAPVSVVLGAVVTGYAARSGASEVMPVSEFPNHTHIQGLAVDPKDPASLLIATHHGLFRSRPDGMAERISDVQDFMGFNAHPSDPGILYASGHPAGGGNLGFIASTDKGRTWTQISPGLDGPVDFHQMTVSPADPKTIYGAYGSLQLSRDGGKTWEAVGPAPARLIDLAASARDADTLYAATESALLVSTDAGTTWSPLVDGAPVSLVEVTPDGSLYAFVLGRGLVRSAEPPVAFETVSSAFGDAYLLHFAGDPADPGRLFGATGEGQVLASTDRGRTWEPIAESAP